MASSACGMVDCSRICIRRSINRPRLLSAATERGGGAKGYRRRGGGPWQPRRRSARGGNHGRGVAEPISLDTTLDFLGKNYAGLHTPGVVRLAARCACAAPRTGRWLVSARMQGRGKFVGEMTIAQGAAPDEFTTTVKLQPVNGGPTLTRTGTSLVYTGYSWRGRSRGGTVGPNSAPDDLVNREMRESMWISPDQITGGRVAGSGANIRSSASTSNSSGPSAEPAIAAVDRLLKTGSQSVQRIHIFGANLPAQPAPTDVDFGAGVTVKSIASHNFRPIVVAVGGCNADAVPGKPATWSSGTTTSVQPNAIAVYEAVDYIKVTARSVLFARLGRG